MKIVKYVLNPIVLLILAGVLVGVAFAQPEPVAPPATVPAATAPATSPAPTVPPLPGDKANPTEGHKEVSGTSTEANPTTDELLDELKSLRKDYAEYKSAEAGGKRAALFGLIAAISLFLTKLLKAPLAKKYGKGVIPKVGLALGVAVGLCSALAAGQPVLDSVLYGAGPPLATFLHELMKKQPKEA